MDVTVEGEVEGQYAVTFLPKCKKVGRKIATDTKTRWG
jgi:hypothetical protein